MKKVITTVGLALGLASGNVLAQQVQQSDFYAGGGLNMNSLSGADDSLGYQFFVGYKLDRMLDLDQINLGVELGYWDSGDFDFDAPGVPDDNAAGLWTTAVVGFPISRELQVFGRAGLDFGDDDGPMFGLGAGYALSNQLELRGEYVARDNVNSVQANLAYHF